MAFRKNPGSGTVTLTFDGTTDYPGLTVVLRKMSVNAWLEAVGLVDGSDNANGLVHGGLLRGIQAMTGYLVSWDLEEEDGTPVPVEDALDQDKDMLAAIYTGWLDGSVGVPAPLEQNSSDGPPLVRDVPLPMDLSSPSHPS